MNAPADWTERLRAHHALCTELLQVVEKENALLRSEKPQDAFALRPARKNLLAQLDDSLDKIRELRMAWLGLEPAQRQAYPEIADLLRENQDTTMKILVLDRENEQTLLRHGLVPPRHVPSAKQQRPHFVASMYQRNAAV